MRLILFLNNWGGWQVGKWLHNRREDVVALVIQPETDERFAREILEAMDMPKERIVLAPRLRDSETLAFLKELRPDLGISAWFGYILKPELLQLFPNGCINLHPAYLPWNRGWYTNVWPILDGSPAGVTIHYIDPGVDTGDIIAQTLYTVEPTDTAGSLHKKLTTGLVDLFKATWTSIRAGTAPRIRQDHSLATLHKKSELGSFDRIDLERPYVGRELLNLLRARTYPPYPAAYFEEKDTRVYVRVELREILLDHQETLPTPIDIDKAYPAGEFLKLLRPPGNEEGPAVCFPHGNRKIGVRARYLSGKDLKPDANPAWMTDAG